jgi:hypothetical protein
MLESTYFLKIQKQWTIMLLSYNYSNPRFMQQLCSRKTLHKLNIISPWASIKMHEICYYKYQHSCHYLNLCSIGHQSPIFSCSPASDFSCISRCAEEFVWLDQIPSSPFAFNAFHVVLYSTSPPKLSNIQQTIYITVEAINLNII